MSKSDTFVALSTPAGESAIALIRLSGALCTVIAEQLLAKDVKPRNAHYIPYRSISAQWLDDCVMTYFPAGASFTGDAMLEIATHGNPLIVHNILKDLQARGCRLAEPGEFSKTAFLNGRIDLSQAEAISDLIRARSDRALAVAERQMHGAIGRRMSELTQRLLGIVASFEAYIDFPEEDLPDENQDGPIREIKTLIKDVSNIIDTNEFRSVLSAGIKTLIVGEPNAGKSSLINALTGSDRSIVSQQPGTTRDYIAATIMLNGWAIELIDTAGLHATTDSIEQLGIERTLEQANNADFFLLVLDRSKPSPSLPAEILDRLHAKNAIVLENKCDLPHLYPHADFFPQCPHLQMCLSGEIKGLTQLRSQWTQLIEKNLSNLLSNDELVVNARHVKALSAAREALKLSLKQANEGELSELIVCELRVAIEQIGAVVGTIDNEQMLDCLFNQFCIGK
jgi:tRNA modification GTPase